MAAHDSWMPFFIADYLADTQHLDRSLHGSYLLLIFACWKAGGELVDDDRLLAAAAKCTEKEWRKDRKILSAFFLVEEGIRWTHKRVTKELAKSLQITETRRLAGIEGAAKRWHNDSKPNGKHDSKPIAQAMAEPSKTMTKRKQTPLQNDAPLQRTEDKKEVERESDSLPARARSDRDDPGIEQFVPEAPDAPDPATKPAFLRRHLTQQAIPPNWRPSTMAIQRLRASRPDMTDAQIAEETERFLSWCAETGKTSFSAEDTWLNFMRKTHVSKPASEDEFDDPGTRAIAAAVARRYPNG